MDKFWKKEAIGYQIYLKSFFDSNGDGIGDINGVTEKLDYIKSLGANFIWISPCYDSPMVDNGYDIRDYFEVDKSYGTNDDLKNLIKIAHSKGIKVILDLVMNHTSDECDWFIKSENREKGYEDFYYWSDGKVVDGKTTIPNNWQSFFSGTAWAYSEKRKQYYLRIFAKKMPDINYESELAFESMEKVIGYYAKFGVDGFRVDAIAHIGKDRTFADSKNKKTYKSFSNLPDTHRYLQRFNKYFTKYNLVTMGELGGDPTKRDLEKYTTNNELDMVFSFEQCGAFNSNHTINRRKLYKALAIKNSLSDSTGWAVLFWNNHDYARLINKIRGEKDIKNAYLSLATLMYMMKGTPIVYNGEELGVDNYPFENISDFKDVNAIMEYENSVNKDKTIEKLKEFSRDNARTIMPWSGDKYSGFSTKKPWFHLSNDYKFVNVQSEENDNDSVLAHYKKLLSTRKDISDIIINGKYRFIKKKSLFGYIISDCGKKYMVCANLSSKERKIKYTELLYSNKEASDILLPYQVIVAKL